MKRIQFLDYLRVIAIFMVLVIHSAEPYYLGADGNAFVASRFDGVWVTFFELICRACVPLFVMASAYLLFPLTKPTGGFLKRRLLKVGLPFAFWCCVYTWWNNGEWGRMLFNFPSAAGGHLWFVPMLFGLYLLIPLISVWAEKVSETELRYWILGWLFTTLIPFARLLFAAIYGSGWAHLFGEANFDNIPFVWGECAWNSFGTFQYLSGFIGYMLFALYFRKFAPRWTRAKTLLLALGTFILGAAVMASTFGIRLAFASSYPIDRPYGWAVELETSIEYCSLGVALTTFAWFALIRTFCTGEGTIYCRLIRPLSEASFGVYLIHILILVPISSVLKPILPTPFGILSVAVLTFTLSSIVVLALKKIPLIKNLI